MQPESAAAATAKIVATEKARATAASKSTRLCADLRYIYPNTDY
jgi:hypothetical protein